MKKIYLIGLTVLIVGCQGIKKEIQRKPIKSAITAVQKGGKDIPKQEITKSHNWAKTWGGCSYDIALKKDGSLWHFGEKDCSPSQIMPMNPKESYIYHLVPKKLGNGFQKSKVFMDLYKFYIIKENGTLWRWGEINEENPPLKAKRLGKSNDWIGVIINSPTEACDLGHDIGIKKDGSLWELPSLKQIGREKSFNKVLVDCCKIYAQKRDGTLWFDGLKKLNQNDKIERGDNHYIESYKELVEKMKKTPLVSSIKDDSEKEAIHSDGTLWLMPEVRIITR